MTGEGKKDWNEQFLQISPAEILMKKGWDKLAKGTNSRIRIRQLLDSCIVKKGSEVMFRKIEETFSKNGHWLSCWESEKTKEWLWWEYRLPCFWKGCPEGKNPTFKPNQHLMHVFDDLNCRGQLFQIFSDSNTITHGSHVNILYMVTDKGYWLSWNGKEYSYRTRNCPGKIFTHIRNGCDKENWVIKKRGKSFPDIAGDQSEDIYDGNVIDLNYKSDFSLDFVILLKDAETNNQEMVPKPDFDEDYIEGTEDVPCKWGWSFFYDGPTRGSCFKTITDNLSWLEAKTRCESLATGSHLASVTTLQENEQIKDYFRSLGNEKEGIWIGLNDREQEDKFEWLDGTPFTPNKFAGWSKPSPYNEDEDCVALWHGGWNWNDASCTKFRFASVCKMPAMRCPDGWSIGPKWPSTGSCFKTLNKLMNWKQARSECDSLASGSSLAKITTREENNFVIDLMKKVNGYVSHGFWMGANDLEREGFYVWLDGSEVPLKDWAEQAWYANEPNDYGRNEDCIHWWKRKDYRWNDSPCDLMMAAVCQMPALW